MGMLNYDFDLGFYSKGFSKAQILGFTSKDIERLEAMEGPEIPDKRKQKEEEKKKKDPNSGGPRPPKEDEYREDDKFPEVSNPNKKD